MQPSLSSSFITYNLTPEEIASGSSYTSSQRAVIQNLIGGIAEEKLTLTFDPINPQVFIQREAELAGQMGILKYLLSLESITSEGNTK